MTGISGISSILSSVFPTNTALRNSSGEGVSSSTSSSGTGWSDKMTISQIRDQVDALASSGQLTTAQQRSLITAGLQDLNANDKSYQPAVAVGDLSRDTEGTFDPSAIMLGRSSFDAAHKNMSVAGTEKDLADLFAVKESSNSFSVTT